MFPIRCVTYVPGLYQPPAIVPMNARRSTRNPRLAASSRRDGAGRPAGRPYTSGAEMGTRICRRGPVATSLGGSLAVVGCGAGSAERQAEGLSPRLPLPSPCVNQRQHRQRPSGRETQCCVGRYSSSCASLTAIRGDFERLGLRSNRTTSGRLLALRLPPALALPVTRLLQLRPIASAHGL